MASTHLPGLLLATLSCALTQWVWKEGRGAQRPLPDLCPLPHLCCFSLLFSVQDFHVFPSAYEGFTSFDSHIVLCEDGSVLILQVSDEALGGEVTCSGLPGYLVAELVSEQGALNLELFQYCFTFPDLLV